MKQLPIDKEELELMLTETLNTAAEARDKAQLTIERIARIKQWLTKQEVKAIKQ